MPSNDADMRMLRHCEGVQGSTTIVDSAVGGTAKSFTCGGYIDHAQAKFGDSSLYCYGINNNLTVAASTDFNFGWDPWTLEIWARIATGSKAHLFCWYLDEDNYFGLEHVTGAGDKVQFLLRWMDQGVQRLALTRISSKERTVVGDWHCFRIMRDTGYGIGIYIDDQYYTEGVIEGDYLNPISFTEFNFGAFPLYIGRAPKLGLEGLQHLDGHIDEVSLHMSCEWGYGLRGPIAVRPVPAAPRFEQSGRGLYVIRANREQRAAGEFGIGSHRYVQSARGTCTIRAGVEQAARGTFNLLANREQGATGIFGVGDAYPTPRAYEQTARGSFVTRESREQSARGVFNVYTVRYEQTATGTYNLRIACDNQGVGTYAIQARREQAGRGQFAVNSAAAGQYELYHALGSEPDLTAAPWKTFASLPYESSTTMAGEGKHYLVLRYRNVQGLVSRNIVSRVIELDDADAEIRVVPTMPIDVAIVQAGGLFYQAVGAYCHYDDMAGEENGSEDNRADQWLLYVTTDGSDPDPDVDEPAVTTIRTPDALAYFDSGAVAVGDGLTVKAKLAVRRTADSRDSAASDTVTVVIGSTGPATPSVKRHHRVRGTLVEIA